MSITIRALVIVPLLVASAVPSAQSLNDAVQAYAWAHNPTAASYTPNPDYSFSASGGAITAFRDRTGVYRIVFEGVPGDGGNVQVSAYGSNTVCSPLSWTGRTGLTIEVVCRNPTTLSIVDSPYTVLFTRHLTGSPRVAYAFANDRSAASYTPDLDFSYNPSGGAITITRTGTGSYTVVFAGVSADVANAGSVQVSGLDSNGWCLTGGWGSNGSEGLRITVRCYLLGNLTDMRFTVLFVEGAGGASRAVGYAWANNPTAASYTPQPSYAYAHGGGTITATRFSVGQYTMSFSGIGSHGGGPGGTAQVTTYGGSGNCTVQGWNSEGTSVDVLVFCYDRFGTPVDTQYQALFLWPDRVSTALEMEPDDGAAMLVLSGPNPTRTDTEVAVTLLEAADAHVRVFDALGREVAALHDGPLVAGTTVLEWNADAVPPGTYRVRLETGGTVRTLPVTVVR